MDLKIEYVPIESIAPYTRNARKHSEKQIERIKESIKVFGFRDPVGIWNGQVVEGHGRLMAAKALGMKTVPVIRLDDMTDEERRAYALAHNRTAELSVWDIEMMDLEIGELQDFAFDLLGFADEPERKRKKAENFTDRETDPLPRLQHNVFDNFERGFMPETYGKYDIPVMERTDITGDKFLRFCDWKEIDDPADTIAHFYYDDYKFIATWDNPDVYVDRLAGFKAVVAPDFSLYTDFPLALQIMSCYRRQWIGAYWQSLGLTVIPDVVWGDERSFEFCFDGIPTGGTVAVSSVGVKLDKQWNGKRGDAFKRGYDEMLRRIEPETVLFYGDMIDGLEGNIIRIPSFYAQKRESLNERKRKKDGTRQ